MPLFKSTDFISPLIPSPPGVTEIPIIDTASVYNSINFEQKVYGYLEGTPWTVIYYGRFLGNADVSMNSNDTNDPTLKQYCKINNFELRVTSSLSHTTNQETGTSQVVGESNVYGVITPVVGDIFLGSASNNSNEIFEVVSVDRATYFQESVNKIRYHQIGYLTPENLTEINTFVVSEIYFDIGRYTAGQQSLYSKSEYLQFKGIKDYAKSIVDKYVNEFYYSTTNTFVYRGTDDKIYYDQHLLTYWHTLINSDDCVSGIYPKNFDVKNTSLIKPYVTIFDLLIGQNLNLLEDCIKCTQFMSTVVYNILFTRYSIYTSYIDAVITPYIAINNVADISSIPQDTSVQLIAGTYIFTTGFYNGLPQTTFEVLVMKYLRREAIKLSDVIIEINLLKVKTSLERFYQTPIILALVRVSR